jgi:arabinan endo-1,5-alpha-L-arabinosidase
VIRVGDRYYLYTAANSGQTKADVSMIWTKDLDPASPDHKWSDPVVVASSDGVEDANAIDPGVFLDPNDGRLWLTYGSYFGYIRLVELDPKNGKQLRPNQAPYNIAINSEASIMIYRDGWYYLLVTHGSCCRGADSGYNIRMGRSKKVTGPFVDNLGLDMLQGGGKLFAGSTGRAIGPGHFGLLDLGEGVQKFSMHYEADLDRGGASVLEIRPLLWRDGWPVEGENARAGTYQVQSVRTGTSLELAVEGVPVGGRNAGRGRGGAGGGAGRGGAGQGGAGRGGAGQGAPGRGGPGGGGLFAGTGSPIPAQNVAEASAAWPKGNIDIRMANYMSQAQQNWTLTPVPDAGGYPGSPYFKITIAGTDRVLAATTDAELIALPAFTGEPTQLWRIEQLADGGWRIMPKSVPGHTEPLSLSAIGSSFATLAKFDPASEKQRWLLKVP